MNHNQDGEVVLGLEQPLHSSNTPPPTISFGNILQKFPEFLLHILPYIPDRIIWNSIASSNKKIYGKTKDEEAYQPPWPINFKLRIPGYSHDKIHSPVWSPDGTQIACFGELYDSECTTIVIFDQRRGLLHFHRHGDDDNDENNEIGWCVYEQGCHYMMDVRFSPDGSFLVSAGEDGLIKIWNYNSTDGYYQQLQEWNVIQETNTPIRYIRFYIDVSPCSRYVAILSDRHVLLKDVQNNGKTIKSVLLPEYKLGKQIMFSSIDSHHSIFIRSENVDGNGHTINIWRPRDDLFTILEHPNTRYVDNDFALSRDNSMVAICATEDGQSRVMLYYFNKSATNSKLSLKQSLSGHRFPSIRFTPDGKYLSYLNENRLLVFFSLITGSEITDQMNLSYSKKDDKISLTRVTRLTRFDFSPVGCGQRFLVQERAGTSNACYIASFWESGLVQNN